MQAEIVLTPTESKKLIAAAVLQLPEVRDALAKGIVTIHPSSSTIFMYEALTGRLPEGIWVHGITVPKGLCISKTALLKRFSSAPVVHDPRNNRSTWFFKKGRLQEQITLGEILDQMTETDVYIKGPNAVDPQGNVGVLYANPAGGGGTIGRVIAARRRQHFHLLLPVGLEKLIPVSIAAAIKKAGFKKVNAAMGLPCGLIRVPGRKIDEVDALAILSGAEATPIAAGGLAGAEGAIVLAVQGTDEQVQKAYDHCRSVKGAKLPELAILDCDACQYPTCHFAPAGKRE